VEKKMLITNEKVLKL